MVAVAMHAGIVALLLLQPAPPPLADIEPRMTVSLASEVSLEATAPRVTLESREAIAPTQSDRSVAPSEEVEADAGEQTPSETTPPPPSSTQRASVEREPETEPRSARDSASQSSQSPRKAEGSRIGEDFLSGSGSSSDSDETGAPAATFGRTERAALSSAITRQLRPHWNAPTGVDAEKLVSVVSWKLNPDGSLKGRPTCRNRASSITASNRPQAGLHCERAIRAVQLAAPFTLPEQFYSRWDDLEWQFDRRL